MKTRTCRSCLGKVLTPTVLGAAVTFVLSFGVSGAPVARGADHTPRSCEIKAATSDDTGIDWTLVFTGVGTVAALIGAVVACLAVKAFGFSTWLKAQEIYMDDDFQKAREAVFAHFGFEKRNPPTFDGQKKEHAQLVCQKMDELAHLKKYVGKKKIIETWGHQMGKSWIILEKFVSDVRTQDMYPKKWDAFKGLAEEAITKYDLRKLNEIRFKAKSPTEAS